MGNYYSKSRVAFTKQDLQSNVAKLAAKEHHQQVLADQHLLQAKQFKTKGDKHQALLHLRLRQNILQKREQLIKMRGNLVIIKDDLDMGELLNTVMSSMKEALDVMRVVAKGQNVDEVDKMMDEFAQLASESNEFGTALGGPLEENSDAESEYEKLESELLADRLNAVKVPTDNVNREVKELSALCD